MNALPGRVKRIVGDHWYEGTEMDGKYDRVIILDPEAATGFGYGER